MIEAIIFGFLGSFHCIGMCGPIAMALPVNHENSFVHKTLNIFIYNLGRVCTYAVIGLLFGLIGLGFKLAGLQQSLSIVLGISILVITFFTYLKKKQQLNFNHLLNKPLSVVKSAISKLFKSQTSLSLFTIGILNGLLPCGFVYLGVIWTTSLGDSIQGMLFMIFFGLGTIPAMMGISLMSNLFNMQLRNRIKKVVPVLMLIMGCLLIVRGLNLGIPFLSPHIETTQGVVSSDCH